MELTIKIKDKKIYDALVNFLKSLHIEVVANGSEETQWQTLSKQNLSRAYSSTEPDYSERHKRLLKNLSSYLENNK